MAGVGTPDPGPVIRLFDWDFDMANFWMPLYVGDYLSKTSHLSTEQHGAYLLLIMHYWTNEFLPDNDRILAQVTRMSLKKWRLTRSFLEGYFEVEKSVMWRHPRIEEELKKMKENKEKKRKAGKISAAKRATGVEQVLQQDPQQNGNPSPSPIRIDSINRNGGVRRIGALMAVPGSGTTVTEMSKPEMLQAFLKKLRPAIGRGADAVIDISMHPNHPEFSRAMEVCQRAAASIGKKIPSYWPRYEWVG